VFPIPIPLRPEGFAQNPFDFSILILYGPHVFSPLFFRQDIHRQQVNELQIKNAKVQNKASSDG